MTRVTMFNNPFLLGFDRFEQLLDRATKSGGDGYPPYNIERLGENRLRITLAVAGFAAEDLAVTVEDNQLVIRGKREDGDARAYLHQGIAARQFQRSFVLAEGLEVTDATIDNGLLHIDLAVPTPQSRSQTVEIRRAGNGTGQA